MDKFKYIALLKKIETTKLVKDLEEIVRDLSHRVSRWRFKDDSILKYKLYTYALNKFKEKSSRKLPDYMYDSKEMAHLLILEEFFKDDNPPSYKELIETFEFDEVLHIPFSFSYLYKIDKVIGTKNMPFRINWAKNQLTGFDRHSTKFNKATQNYLVGLRYKQVNFPNSNRPVVESYLEYYKPKTPTKQQDIDAAILLLEQQINAIKGL